MTTALLLAADFDGTLAEISLDPSAATLDPQFAAFLRRAADIEGVEVAIISGRDLDDLSSRVRDLPAYLSGSHGLEIKGPTGKPLRETAPLEIELDAAIEREAKALGMLVEKKRHGISLHWRGLPIDSHHPLLASFRDWATTNQLDLIRGRRVLEARRHGGGKEDALRFLTATTGAQRVVYAGDDLTDFAALGFAAARGRAYFVTSHEREAPSIAIGVNSRDDLLRCFIEETNRV